MRHRIDPDQASRTALVVVRNTVVYDSRVLREAGVLRDLGYDVVVAGVVSPEDNRTELDVDGAKVVRFLGPLQWLKGLLRRRRATHTAASTPTARNPDAVPKPDGRLRRLIITFAYYLQGIVLVWRMSPAIVHANDYNTMWIGVSAKLLRRSRLVYDSHELWPDRNGRSEWRPWLIACESLFVRLADATMTVSPGCAEVMARRYRVPAPVVVRNVPERVARSATGAGGTRASEGPTAVYAGILAPGRGLEQAIQALASVPALRLRLVGPSADGFETKLRRCAEKAGVGDRVDFSPPVPPRALAETIGGADMGLVLIEPICLSYELSLPNKLFEYVAAGLPVIASDLPVMGPLVRDEAIGEVALPTDLGAIAEAMRRLADPERNAEARRRVRSFGERVNWGEERVVLEDIYARILDRTP